MALRCERFRSQPINGHTVSSPIIAVENLGKKYRLDHHIQQQRYTALRDVIAEWAKRPFRTLRRQRGSNSAGRTEEFWALKVSRLRSTKEK